ncbi:MFS family permease [Clostridium punense]|uniref:MFS family permease n=1 Tax=Clostridium punense TaxID=1054297 RepID=A0ABS4K991_9CLOT|nr:MULTISPECIES: MFS transporter [Clostridium]EQB85812.1 hypothetical protein M918_17405 [Clostridium sp. BL8]MBP2024356.1 MFS family permease [Clostridium punense]
MKFGLPKIKLNKDINILLISILVLHIASYIVNPILPVIFKSEKGLSASHIGLIIGAGSLAFQGGSILGGLLSDRTGRKTTMVIGSLAQAFGLFGYSMLNNISMLLTSSIIIGIGSGMYAPTAKAAIASLASDSSEVRTTAFSLRGIAANIGVCIAGILIFFLSKLSSNITFYVSTGVYIALAGYTWIFLPKDCGESDCPIIPPNSYLQIFKNKSFMIFSIISLFTWIIYSLLSLLLPLRGEAILANGKLVGTIWTITSVIVIVAQGFISKYILQKVNPLTAIFFGVLFFGGGIFMIGLSYNFVVLTLSSVIFLVGEMLMLPTTDSLTSQLAHPELIGAYFSIANLISGLGTAIGNFAGGRIVTAYGIKNNLTPWFIFLIASVIVAVLVLFTKRMPSIKNAVSSQK